MSTRYAQKALEGLKKRKTMEKLQDLPASIRFTALRKENISSFEDKFYTMKEEDLDEKSDPDLKKKLGFEYDIRTNKPLEYQMDETKARKFNLEEYKKIRDKLDYTKNYTVEQVAAEYKKSADISSPILQRKEQKRLQLIMAKLREEEEEFQKVNLYENEEEQEHGSFEGLFKQLEKIFVKLESLNDSTMMNNFKKAKEIYANFAFTHRDCFHKATVEEQRAEIKNPTKMEKIQQEIDVIMKDYNQYHEKLISKLSKEELSKIEAIFKPGNLLQGFKESEELLLKMVEIGEYTESEEGKKIHEEKVKFLEKADKWIEKIQKDGKLMNVDTIAEAAELMEECGMDLFSSPIKSKYNNSQIPKYSIRVNNTFNFDPNMQTPRDKKIILDAFVRDFNFSLKAFQRFKSIVGKKYSYKKNMLTLRSDIYPTREANEQYVVQLMLEIIRESKLADEGADLGMEPVPVKHDQLSAISLRMKNVETEDRKADEIFEKWKKLTIEDSLPKRPIYDVIKEVIEVRSEEERETLESSSFGDLDSMDLSTQQRDDDDE